MRVKTGVTRRKRHKKILKATKGYHAQASRTYRHAQEAWMKAGQDAYRGRKQFKRTVRALWITRLNAAVRQHGTTYSALMQGLKSANSPLNRKMLSELAIHEPEAFGQIVELAKQQK